MYKFACEYADLDCDWVGRAETKEELLRAESEHLKDSHNIDLSKFSKETGKISNFLNNLEDLGILKKFEGQLFHYYKNTLKTNQETILKVNKLLGL